MVLGLVTLQSCEKETSGGDIEIVYFADLKLLGESVMVLDQGSSFVDPGFEATEQGEDISDRVQVRGTVNTTTTGSYTLTYDVKNSDGYAKSLQRQVFVVPASAKILDIEGVYKGQREGRAVTPAATTIKNFEKAVYFAEDFFGGFYNVVSGYGLSYRLPTYFFIDATNKVIALSNNSPWGPWQVNNGTYDDSSKTFKFTVYSVTNAFGFNVILTKE